MNTLRIEVRISVLHCPTAPPHQNSGHQINGTVDHRRYDRQRPRQDGCRQLATQQQLAPTTNKQFVTSTVQGTDV